MSKSNISSRIGRIEDRTIIRDRPVYCELTEPFNEYGFPNPVISITKDEDGRFTENPRLLTLDEIRQQFATHPKLEEILKSQAECIERDRAIRAKILMEFAPELMEKAVMVVDEQGRRLKIEIPLEDFERYSDPQEDREFDDQMLFNVHEYGSTPSEAVALAGMQRWEKIKAKLKP